MLTDPKIPADRPLADARNMLHRMIEQDEREEQRLPCGDIASTVFGTCAFACSCEYANDCPVS